MKLFKSICLLFAVFTASCDSYFDIGDLATDSRLVLYCMPVAGCDTTVIQLSKSIPVGGVGLPTYGLPGAEVKFSVNGEEKQVLWNEEAKGVLPSLCYYSVAEIKADDRIEVSADFKGLPTVTSSTVVPQAFPMEKVELIRMPGEDSRMQVRVTFTDPDGSDDFFGVKMVRQEVMQESADGVVTDIRFRSIVPCGFTFEDEPVFNNKVGLDAALDFDYDYYDHLYIWSDSDIKGQRYTLRMDTHYLKPSDYSYTDWNGIIIEGKVYYRYKIYLYRLSKESYSFLKSVNDIENNNIGSHGFAPVKVSYTNVSDGFGVVGGCQIIESPWLDNPLVDDPAVWMK